MIPTHRDPRALRLEDAAFVPADPRGSLARIGIALSVYRYPLRLHRSVVYGAWDPVLTRIELFACNAARADEELVATLGHELWHAVHQDDRSDRSYPERRARLFANAWLRHLGADGVRVCAAALRSQAVDRPHRPPFTPARDHVEPLPGILGIGS